MISIQKSKNKILIIPVGEQITPLMYGIKYLGDVEDVLLLHSQETLKIAKKLEKKLKETKLFKNIYKIKVDPRDISDVLDNLSKFFKNYVKDKNNKTERIKIVVNLSGGTKIMSIACYIFSIFFEGECFYIFKKNDDMEFVEVPTIRVKLFEEIMPESKKYQILKLLKDSPKTLREIAGSVKIKDSTAYYHVLVLQKYGWIRFENKKYFITNLGRLILSIIQIFYDK